MKLCGYYCSVIVTSTWQQQDDRIITILSFFRCYKIARASGLGHSQRFVYWLAGKDNFTVVPFCNWLDIEILPP